MEVLYSSEKLSLQCSNKKQAQKLFGGNETLALSLLARINALQSAATIKDIIVQPAFHFHKLNKMNGRDLRGYFAIDVKSRKEQWRIILQPLNEDKQPYVPCNIDEISGMVRIIEVSEVSKHYE